MSRIINIIYRGMAIISGVQIRGVAGILKRPGARVVNHGLGV